MTPNLKSKQVIMIAQASTTNAATASGSADVRGFDFATIDVIMATSDNVTNNPSVLLLDHSDDLTTYTALSTGDSDFTIANCVTAGNWGMKFNVNLRGKARYLRVRISPLTTQVISAICNLFGGDESPDTTTEANVKNLAEVA